MPELLTKVSETQDKSQKLSMLQHYVENMQEEMKKIDAFKRIGRLKAEVMECSKSQKQHDDDDGSIYENQIQVCSYNRSKGRQIMTFNGNSQFPSLSLVTPKYDFYYSKIGSMQFQRWKCRRRWSPALHQIFEDVLQRLGGPNGAKPKQVKELMNVDGLTCDEVKSHLQQKYRLGLQRPPNSASATTRGRPRQMNIRRHLPNQSSTTSQSGSPQVTQFVTHDQDTSTSGGGGDSTEAAVDENLSDGHSWRGRFRVMN
ncbi:hypothetical protein EZV62_014063 [Acer yangbiense]|uniref:HTH myb-type domain-containing protein n=1 Tax=Acer yangbiense TaxID=1000413 RepID=A0A5C7HR43_9ROSI|nr:hypothetical protein EZV62_014063 [Acer yangbiense]